MRTMLSIVSADDVRSRRCFNQVLPLCDLLLHVFCLCSLDVVPGKIVEFFLFPSLKLCLSLPLLSSAVVYMCASHASGGPRNISLVIFLLPLH